MSYTRVNWQNSPNTSTPLSAENLNKMDAGIEANANAIDQINQHTYDAELDGTSTNAPQTKAVYEALNAITFPVDSALNPNSSNPVENGVITERINELQTDIDGKASIISKSVSGIFITITDGADNVPVKGLTVNIEPFQDLHGQDAPYPAGCGKNLFNKNATNTENGYSAAHYLSESGSISGSANYNVSEYIAVNAETAYTLSPTSGTNSSLCFYDSTKTYISGQKYNQATAVTFTTPAGTAYIRASIPVANVDTFMLELGSSATAYAPYSNICPIGGWSSVTVGVTAKNLLDTSQPLDDINVYASDGTPASSTRHGWNIYLPAGTYTISYQDETFTTYIYANIVNADESFVSFASITRQAYVKVTVTFTLNDGQYLKLYNGTASATNISNKKIMLEAGSEEHTYEPFQGNIYTFQLGQTVYGGTLDVVAGKMVISNYMDDLGDLDWTYNDDYAYPYFTAPLPNPPRIRQVGIKGVVACAMYQPIINRTASDFRVADFSYKICLNSGVSTSYRLIVQDPRYTDAVAFKTAVTGVKIVTMLPPESRVEIDLTPAQITTLLGINNIWTNADSLLVNYCTDTKLYLDETYVVDDALSETSENPVQNKVINARIGELSNAIDGLTATVNNKANVITETASGSIASFDDGADAMPVKGLSVAVEPVQNLHGQEYPYPAGGGKNLITSIYHGSYAPTTGVLSAGEAYRTAIVDNLPAGTYTFSTDLSDVYILRKWTDGASTNISSRNSVYTFTTTVDGKFMLCFRKYDSTDITETINIQIEAGSSNTSFVPYENICPISGWDSVDVWRTGKNLLPDLTTAITYNGVTYAHAEGGGVKISGTATANSYCNLGVLKLPAGTYVVNGLSGASNASFRIGWQLYDGTQYGTVIYTAADPKTITLDADSQLRFRLYTYPEYGAFSDLVVQYQLERGNTVTEYEPYQGQTYTFPIGQTVYGGTLDAVAKKMVVDHTLLTLDGTETWAKYASYDGYSRVIAGMKSGTRQWGIANWLKRNTGTTDPSLGFWLGVNTASLYVVHTLGIVPEYDVTAWRTYLAGNPLQVYIPLAEPIEIPLTAEQITTLKGTNNIWADSGDVSTEYCADTKLYIQKVITTAISALS